MEFICYNENKNAPSPLNRASDPAKCIVAKWHENNVTFNRKVVTEVALMKV